MSKIYFDHSWTEDKEHLFFKYLGKIGFNLVKEKTEHPGSTCQFIRFPKGYLEFIWQKKKNFPKVRKQAGLSFGVVSSLSSLYDKKYNKLDYQPTFEHRNYDWKENSKDILPGWNFVNFNKPSQKMIEVWFTEYEKNPKLKQEKNSKPPVHPNGVCGISKLNIKCTSKSYEFYKKILNKRSDKGSFELFGIKLNFEIGNFNLFQSIELKCQSLEVFSEVSGLPILKEGRKSFCFVKNPGRGWDLIVAE